MGRHRPKVVDQGEVVREDSDTGRVSAIWWSLCQDMVGEWWARSTMCLAVTLKVGVGVDLVPGR